MSSLRIKQLSLYSFLVLIIGFILSSIILSISLNKIESLNENLNGFSNVKNSFLKLKIKTEEILITKDLDETVKQWNASIVTFEKSISFLSTSQKSKVEDLWYISKKEIDLIKEILSNKNLSPQSLKEKPVLFLQGQMFTLKDKTETYSAIFSLIRKLEYLLQYEKLILEEIQKIDKDYKTYIDRQINITINYSIVFMLLVLFGTIFIIVVMSKKVLAIESQLLNTQDSLRDSLAELKNSKILLQNIIDSTPASIFWKDIDNKYIGVNKSFLKDVKVKRQEDIIGKTDLQMPWKNDEALKYIEDDKEVMRSAVPKLQIEETHTNIDGDIINVIVSKVPLSNSRGEVIGMLGIYIDITEKERIREELFKKDKLLAQSSKMAAMGEMLENIAHQWRQPLSYILTSSTGIKLKKDFEALDDEFLLESLSGIEDAVKHLNKTIDDFRNFFKRDKDFTFFDMEASLDKSLSLVESKLKNKSINIERTIFPSKAYGLENEFIQVLMNILNNSIDELEKTSFEKKLIFIKIKEIEVCGDKVSSTISDCKCIELKVYDNAGGIPASIIDNVFDAYFTTKNDDKGTGIGLYMSKEIIENHMNGSLQVENRTFEYENKEYTGAEFTILLPADDYILNEK